MNKLNNPTDSPNCDTAECINVKQQVTVGTTLDVTGKTTLSDLEANGTALFKNTLGVTGTTTLSDLQVAGNVTISQGSAAYSANGYSTGLAVTADASALAPQLRVVSPANAIFAGVFENSSQQGSTLYALNSQTGGTAIMGVVATTSDIGLTTNGQIQSSGTVQAQVNQDGAAIIAENYGNSGAGILVNSTGIEGTGITSRVAGAGNVGLTTNGQVISQSGSAMLTHLPTQNGHRVVTSPLSLQSEVHLSGSAQLTHGKATIQLAPDAADLIHHTANTPYKVFLTPSGQCAGLAVTLKNRDHFVVEELMGGKNNISFDWFIIARKPSEPGSTCAHELIEQLPEMDMFTRRGPTSCGE